MKQQFELYTAEDRKVWNLLFTRQWKHLQDKACSDYLAALEEMHEVLNAENLPDFERIDKWFYDRTGWQIACVPGLIEVTQFFELLAQKKFPSSTWLRSMEKLDYLEEPDMFHDIFGHVPLLANPVYSDFMHQFGLLGQKHLQDDAVLVELQRLYWYTIEFGLFLEQTTDQDNLRILGAGIISSFNETTISLESEKVMRVLFDLEKIRSTAFRTDTIQSLYFVTESMEQLQQSIYEFEKQLINEMA